MRTNSSPIAIMRRPCSDSPSTASQLDRLFGSDTRSIGRLSASAPSHHDLFLAVFITNIAESEFSAHTGAQGAPMRGDPLRSGAASYSLALSAQAGSKANMIDGALVA
jgi:hypothetical protein